MRVPRRNMPFPFFDETSELNDIARQGSAGSFIALPDGVTHYELSGAENGIPVVLTHGFSTPYFIFDTPFDFLVKSGFRVLRYDLFGRGLSDRPVLQYDIHLFVRQLEDLLEAMNFERINLAGLSMGGPITTAFIDRHPGTVAKHILIDPAGAKRIALSTLLEVTKLRGLGELTLAFFGRVSMVRSIAKDMITADAMAAFQERYQVQMQYIGFKRAILSTMRNRMLESFYETYERVGKLGIPTLVFWGIQDKTVPFEDSQALLKAIPHAEFHALENCGHLPHYEKPEIVNPILLEFLRRP
jgi:pimeloyl-ACP methyl ester carboxylesterase